ncbi:MAG: peptidylprolyl isomerase [Thiobacillaceae bacterium]
MKRLFLSSFLTLIMPAVANESDVIARMGELTLTRAEVRQLAETNPAEAGSAPGLERLVRTEIIRRAVAAEARHKGFDRKPEMAARMEQAARQALVAAYVNDLTRPPEDYPSEEQLRQAYEAHKASLQTPRQYRLAQIYIAGTDAAARKRAEDLVRELRRRGADFAAVARRASQHAPSAAKGGDIGWLAEAELQPAIREAVEKAGKGDIIGPVQGAAGWHVLRLEERKEPQTAPFEQVRDGLRNSLRLRRAAEIEAAYLDGLMARTPVTVNGIALEEMHRR